MLLHINESEGLKMKKILTTVLSLSILLSHTAILAEENTLNPIQNFMGRSNSVSVGTNLKNGWERVEVSWEDIESKEGTYNEDKLKEIKKEISDIRNLGKECVIMLTNPPAWASNTEEYTYEDDGVSVKLGIIRGIKYGMPYRNVTKIDNGVETVETNFFTTEQVPMNTRGISAWKSFAEKVSEYFKDDIKYVQIYKNPFGEDGNYFGSLIDFFNEIHEPAAEAFHNNGYKVLTGGVENNLSVDDFVTVIEGADAWNSIDVYSLNYAPMASVDYLYNLLKEKGIESPSIWITESGYANGVTYTSNFYSRFFCWALERMNVENQFKVFWSEELQGTEVPLCNTDGTLTDYGRTYSALITLLDGNEVKLYSDSTNKYSLKPVIYENRSSMEGFIVDNKRIVLASHMMVQNTAGMFTGPDGDSLHLGFSNSFLDITVPGIDLTKPYTTKRGTVYGATYEIPHLVGENGEILLSVAVPDNLAAPAQNVGETAEALEANRRDQARTFYTVIEYTE